MDTLQPNWYIDARGGGGTRDPRGPAPRLPRHPPADRPTLIGAQVGGETRLGFSCSNQDAKPAECPKNLSSFWRSVSPFPRPSPARTPPQRQAVRSTTHAAAIDGGAQTDSGATWDMGTNKPGVKYPPIGTIGHPDTKGWSAAAFARPWWQISHRYPPAGVR
jgi:hypothetical protein